MGSATTAPVILLSIKSGFKISPFASLQLKCLCGNCISTWALGSHQLSLLDAEQTAATGDGVSCSDPPYLLYHLSTACWIVAAFLFSFFLRLHASFKPAFNSNIHFSGGKKCGMIWNWMISLPLLPYFLEAQWNMLSFLPRMETFERGR